MTGECNIHASLRNKLERIAGYPFSANEADRARRLKGIYEYIPTHLADHLKSIEEQNPLNPIKQSNCLFTKKLIDLRQNKTFVSTRNWYWSNIKKLLDSLY